MGCVRREGGWGSFIGIIAGDLNCIGGVRIHREQLFFARDYADKNQPLAVGSAEGSMFC